MLTTGIVKDIGEDTVSIEIFEGGSPEDKSACASGDCASCAAAGKTKLIKALNTNKLPIKKGELIEMELSASKAIGAAFRVLIMPLLLFIAAFYFTGLLFSSSEGIQAAGGFIGLGLGFLVNLGISSAFKTKEMPVILRIL